MGLPPLSNAAHTFSARILVVDDELSMRELLEIFLSQLGHTVQVASDGATAMRLLIEEEPFDLVLTDLRMPGAHGMVVLERTRDLHPDTPIIVMSPIPHDTEGLRAINQGARGYCHLYANPALLQEVARAVQAGSLWVGPELVDRLVAAARSLLDKVETARQPASNATSDSPSEANRPDLSMLSPREREVADQVALGKTNKEIARTLDITERTVKAHLGAVFEKLAVRDRLQLVLFMSPGTSTRG